MKITVVSYSLSQDPATLTEWKNKLLSEIKNLVSTGVDIILYPELFLMGLGRYFKTSSAKEEIEKVAEYITTDVLPAVAKEVGNKVLILGSGPRKDHDQIFNSAPVFHDGKVFFQDKLFLTPWETEFTAGTELKTFMVNGLKVAVVICFDSEQPDLAMKLKSHGIDLMLVPSATTNRNGSNRVNRCSSARSVELGAVVVTSPLVGDSPCDLVDHNEGRQGFFLPAQDEVTADQETFSEYSSEKHIISQFSFDEKMILNLKKETSETKPFHKAHHSNLKIIC